LPNFHEMVQQCPAMSQWLSQRPEPLDIDSEDGSSTEDQEFESLDWTFTPNFLVLKDGHSRCFIATARPTQETRQPGLHLVREVEIQPSCLEKKRAMKKKCHSSKKALEIRVREEDLRKFGDNLNELSQCALPSLKPPQAPGPEQEKNGLGNKRRHAISVPNHARQSQLEPLQSLPEAGWNLRPSRRTPSKAIKHSSSAPNLGTSGKAPVRLPTVASAQPAVMPAPDSEKKRRGSQNEWQTQLAHLHGKGSWSRRTPYIPVHDWQHAASRTFSHQKASTLGSCASLPSLC